MEVKVGCRQIGHDALDLYVRAHDVLEALKRVEVPPEYMILSLEKAIYRSGPSHLRQSAGFLSEGELMDLGKLLTEVSNPLPTPAAMEDLNGAERWDLLKPSLDKAVDLVKLVEGIVVTKVVECQCRE